jgi:N-acetylmuramic acid 6-phosphate etherase
MNKLSITESHNPNTINIDLMDSIDIARTINNEDKKISLAIEKCLQQIAESIDMVASSLNNVGRLLLYH